MKPEALLAEALRRPWLRVVGLSLLLLLPAILAWFVFPSAPLPAAVPSARAPSAGAEAAHEEEAELDLLEPAPPTPREAVHDTPRGVVSGTVVDGNGRAVANASVTCEDRANLSATTDENGKWELPPEADGCKALVTSLEHDPLPAVVVTSDGKNRLEVGSPGGISGVVVDDTGHPLTEYTIAIEQFTTPDGERGPWMNRRESIKNQMGTFELDGLSAGRYVLTASAKGKPPVQSEGIEVENGRKTTGVRITIGRGGKLIGVVTDRATKQPIAGVSVRLDGVTGTGAGGSTKTDDQGRYALEGVPTTAFSARFTHPDYRERIEPLDPQGQTSIRADVDLGEKGDGANSEWTGIGATLSGGGKFVEVAGVFDGGPAATAGMKAGDKIVEIEGKSVQGATVADCVSKLRGPEGSKVDVTVERGGTKQEITITRARITR